MNSRSLLQGHLNRRNQNRGFVSTRRTHVGQFLTGQAVYRQVVGTAVNTDDLAFVNFSAVAEEQLTAIPQTEQRERYRFTLTVGRSVRRCYAGPLRPDERRRSG